MLDQLKHYVYAYVDTSNERILYIGKGINARALDHVHPNDDTAKHRQIMEALDSGRLRIDILRHGIETDRQAKLIEATCIDLFGVDQLLNAVRGHGTAMGRMPIEELLHVVEDERVEVRPEHAGIAIILNSTYKSGMTDLQLFEATRGIWKGIPSGDDLRYAYATYGGIVKEVYRIEGWVPAGTNQYFTRDFTEEDLAGRREFIGRIAQADVRGLYKGKAITMARSYGSPLMPVGRPGTVQ
jgi:hypothetical protein